MTTTKREDVLDGIVGHTPGPWKIIRYSNFAGWAVSSPGRGCIAERWYSKTAHVESIYDDGEMEANATLVSRAPALVDEIRTLRAVLSECAKQLAAMGATGHATRARTLLPDPPETRTEGEG